MGFHAGEVETGPAWTTGLAIHLAARVMAEATAGGIVVSRTVRDLASGSDIVFTALGERGSRGPGQVGLFAVTDGRSPPTPD
jgi:class 3 adenylate cyclase